MKKKLVVLTGAGMSAESGISLPIRNWYSTFITNDVGNY